MFFIDSFEHFDLQIIMSEYIKKSEWNRLLS